MIIADAQMFSINRFGMREKDELSCNLFLHDVKWRKRTGGADHADAD